mgnify:FL=1
MKILSILTIILGFSQCGSMKFQENPPFKITSATYENWTGGQPGVKGTNVKIEYTANKIVEFDSIYFSNKVAKLQTKEASKNKMIFGYFNTSSLKNDMVLHSDSTKEMKNTIPKIKKIPFELKENEAVISYKINKKTKYYKITSLTKAKSSFFPSAPK